MLSKRLQQVADMVMKSKVIADIGTDHAYVPIYLVKNKITEKAVAADISAGSCKKAQLNVNANRLSSLIDVRQGNGLEVIRQGENIDSIIISGMGGLLTISVLESNRYAVQGANQLVLQPQRDIDKVRKYIHSIGFKIADEIMFIEGNKFYTAINAVKGNESYSELEYLFGRVLIEKKSAVLKEYIEIELNKIVTVLKNMEEKGKRNIPSYKRLLYLKEKYEEVMKCL